MSSEPIITISRIGKKYNIIHQRGGYVALRDVLMNVIKSPFSFLKSKAKQVAGIETKEEFWALKNINLEVKKGEVIGIIGSNGAGKSTLLKILSQITPPTTGEIIINGTVSSLLEVGTGFHPELTGRENIFLNGAILGMTREEMAKKFDAIVEFAGIEKFLDTQVKHYSSGMYVRLAFSVAAHMDPDILIIDEVLAVGDAEFQKKCLGKMDEITKKEGRTILFVSHNMGAIQELCTRCILIEAGKISVVGNTKEVVEKYLDNRSVKLITRREIIADEKEVKIIDAWIEDEKGNKINVVSSGQTIRVVVDYQMKNTKNKNISFAFALNNSYKKEQLSDIWTNNLPPNLPAKGKVICELPCVPLNTGMYTFNVCIRINGFVSLFIKDMISFEVVFGDFFGTGKLPNENQGSLLLKQNWSIK